MLSMCIIKLYYEISCMLDKHGSTLDIYAYIRSQNYMKYHVL